MSMPRQNPLYQNDCPTILGAILWLSAYGAIIYALMRF